MITFILDVVHSVIDLARSSSGRCSTPTDMPTSDLMLYLRGAPVGRWSIGDPSAELYGLVRNPCWRPLDVKSGPHGENPLFIVPASPKTSRILMFPARIHFGMGGRRYCHVRYVVR